MRIQRRITAVKHLISIDKIPPAFRTSPQAARRARAVYQQTVLGYFDRKNLGAFKGAFRIPNGDARHGHPVFHIIPSVVFRKARIGKRVKIMRIQRRITAVKVPRAALCTPFENRGMVFFDDDGKKFRFEQKGLNVWRSPFDFWLWEQAAALRGRRRRSITVTAFPLPAKMFAAAHPAGPAPTTITSCIPQL